MRAHRRSDASRAPTRLVKNRQDAGRSDTERPADDAAVDSRLRQLGTAVGDAGGERVFGFERAPVGEVDARTGDPLLHVEGDREGGGRLRLWNVEGVEEERAHLRVDVLTPEVRRESADLIP